MFHYSEHLNGERVPAIDMCYELVRLARRSGFVRPAPETNVSNGVMKVQLHLETAAFTQVKIYDHDTKNVWRKNIESTILHEEKHGQWRVQTVAQNDVS